MYTIDFKFFKEMRDKLKAPFNPEELDGEGEKFYTPEKLHILYNSDAILANEKYTAPIFKDSVNNFFLANVGSLKKDIVINLHGDTHCTIFKIMGLMQEEATSESLIAHLPTLCDVGTPAFLKYQAEIMEIYSRKDYYQAAHELIKYYLTWLEDKKSYDEDVCLSFLSDISKLCNSIPALDNLISSFRPKENLNFIGEDIQNIGWGDIVEKWKETPTDKKELYRNIVGYKGLEGLNLILSAIFTQEMLDPYLDLHVGVVTDENIEKIYEGIAASIAQANAKFLDGIDPAFNLLDLAAFKKLAVKYKMPYEIMKDLFGKEVPKFTREDNLKKILSNGAVGGAGGDSETAELKLNVEVTYEKSGKVAKKPYSVELLSKTDPTALFIGKMLKCCQFYTGHSSEQAVLPVYQDPNAGLIIVRDIKDSNKIKAACFTWTNLNDEGEVDGIVLDSFEQLPEAQKAFLPFIRVLGDHLSVKGLKLYIGSGGATPALGVVDELGAIIAAEIHTAPKPLTEGLKNYGDSSRVYLIEAGKEYSIIADTIDNIEGTREYLVKILSKTDAETAKEVFNIYTKMEIYFADTLIRLCVKRGNGCCRRN